MRRARHRLVRAEPVEQPPVAEPHLEAELTGIQGLQRTQLLGYGLYRGAMGHVEGLSPGAVIGAEATAQRAYQYAETRSIQGTNL